MDLWRGHNPLTSSPHSSCDKTFKLYIAHCLQIGFIVKKEGEEEDIKSEIFLFMHYVFFFS